MYKRYLVAEWPDLANGLVPSHVAPWHVDASCSHPSKKVAKESNTDTVERRPFVFLIDFPKLPS